MPKTILQHGVFRRKLRSTEPCHRFHTWRSMKATPTLHNHPRGDSPEDGMGQKVLTQTFATIVLMKNVFLDRPFTKYCKAPTLKMHKRDGRKVMRLIFEVKTSLGALSKNVVGTELHWRVSLRSVTLLWVKSAQVTAIWIGDRYMIYMNLLWVWQKTISSIGIHSIIKSNFNTLFNIIRVCRSRYVLQILFKKLKNNNTAHLSCTNCSLNTNI